MAITTKDKKFTLTAVCNALCISEESVKTMTDGAKELTFSQVIQLASNQKLKRYDDEVAEIVEKLNAFNEMFK